MKQISCGSGADRMSFVRLERPIRARVNGEARPLCPGLNGVVIIKGVRDTSWGLMAMITDPTERQKPCRISVSRLEEPDPETLQELENIAKEMPKKQMLV